MTDAVCCTPLAAHYFPPLLCVFEELFDGFCGDWPGCCTPMNHGYRSGQTIDTGETGVAGHVIPIRDRRSI